MSTLLDARKEIVDALGEIDGVTAHSTIPGTIKPGDAWGQLTGVERSEQGYLLASWEAWILLPQDEVLAYQRFEDLTPDVFDALQPVGYVESVVPRKTKQSPSGPEYLTLVATFIREF